MVTVSQHALKRFFERYYKRMTGWSTAQERWEAYRQLRIWYELSTPCGTNRYSYEDFILVVVSNTIITVIKKA